MGGEIYIHGGGAQRNWTAGCIALEDVDAEQLYALCDVGTEVEIRA
ncbi:MAG: L,D-transpeptidase [Clostridia bacterium]|nr:L,D-transpeptidase [Clostridia bacterium]